MEKQTPESHELDLLRELQLKILVQDLFDERLKPTEEMVARHQQTLHGINGDNGIVSVLTKLNKSYWKFYWLLVGAGAVIMWLINKLYSFG